MSDNGIKVGAAKYCITPPYPIAMGGYTAREGPAEGVHDNLYVRCVYIQDNCSAHVLLTYDLIGLPESFVRRVTQKLNKKFALSYEQIVMHATHTHSGPDLGLMFGIKEDPIMPLYIKMLEEWSISVCAEAMRLSQTVSIMEGTTDILGVGGIRRSGKPSKLPLRVVGFITKQGNLKVALLSFPCHPTIMGAENRLISADYPGVSVSMVEQLLGDGTIGVFLNGATGDISTRFTRRSQSFSEVQRFGRVIGSAAVSTLLAADVLPIQRLYVKKKRLEISTGRKYNVSKLSSLKNQAIKKLEATQDSGERRVYKTQLQGIENAIEYETGSQRYGSKVEVPVSVWMFSKKVGLIFWSGEPFFSFDKEIKKQINSQFTLIGYTDGMTGYIPDVSIEDDPSYEILMSSVGKKGGTRLLEYSKKMYQSMLASFGDDEK